MAKKEFDELMSVCIDIGKDTFHIVTFDPDGQVVMCKQIKRLALVATFEKLNSRYLRFAASAPMKSFELWGLVPFRRLVRIS